MSKPNPALSTRLRWEIQSDPPSPSDPPLPLLLTFSSELRHEPVAPGGNAADNVIRKQLASTPLIVHGTHLKNSFWDGFGAGGVRDRNGDVDVDVELTESGIYEIVDFSLDGDNGWQDNLGRHWYGDEPREVESKRPLF
jgi:hypothetical protein